MNSVKDLKERYAGRQEVRCGREVFYMDAPSVVDSTMLKDRAISRKQEYRQQNNIPDDEILDPMEHPILKEIINDSLYDALRLTLVLEGDKSEVTDQELSRMLADLGAYSNLLIRKAQELCGMLLPTVDDDSPGVEAEEDGLFG